MGLNLPKNWREVSVSQFYELNDVQETQFDSTFEFLIEKLAILLDISSDDELLENLDIDEIVNIMGSIAWINTYPTNDYLKELNHLKIKEFNKLKLGEFIDLDYYVVNGGITNLHKMCAILYKKSKVDEWENILEEPYIYNIEERSNIFLSKPISSIYTIYNSFLTYREKFIRTYSTLFESNDWDKIEDPDNLLSEAEIQGIKKEIEEEKVKSKFSWESIIWELSGHDISRFDAVTDMPLVLVFNILSMKKTYKI